MYYIYVLQAEIDGRFYLGCSSNLRSRLKAHNARQNKSTKYSKRKLVYYEAYQSESYARLREASLKHNERMRSFVYKRIKASLNEEQFGGGGSPELKPR